MTATRQLARILAVAGVSVVAVGCGSSASSTSPPVTSVPASRTASTQTGAVSHPGTQPAKPAGPRVGTTQRVNARGTKLSITVSKVIDPLKGSGAALLPGTRVVGVFVRIANTGPGGYDSSSTGDISIIPSSGVGSPAYAPQGRCQTADRDFDNAIGPGESRAGCVVFTLNTAARLVGERFSADGGGAGVATWRGPKK